MDRSAHEKDFAQADETNDVTVHLAFKERLLQERSPQGCAYHFELISRAQNPHLVDILARFFSWRGKDGEGFLLERLPKEPDPRLLATGLQILGQMRSRKVAAMAREHLNHESAVVRERSCMVLGWVGGVGDLKRLAQLQAEDPDLNTRKWAATQQMHIAERLPKAKDRALVNLQAALAREQEPEVLEMIIYAVECLLKRRFGLKRDANSERLVGDLAEAERKTAVALQNYLGKTPATSSKLPRFGEQ